MKKMFSMSLVMLLAISVILAGCGNKNQGASNANGGDTGGSAKTSNVQIGMVTDVGGVNDKSFNQSAWEALQATEKESGAKVKYLQSKSDQDYIPNLNQFVKGDFNLTWGIGFNLANAIGQVAKDNPSKNLAIIDSVVDAPNVKSVVFAENEGSFLVGVVAGKLTKTNKIGFVGGQDSPLIKRFEKGFEAGIKAVNQMQNWKLTTQVHLISRTWVKQQLRRSITAVRILFSMQLADLVQVYLTKHSHVSNKGSKYGLLA